MADDKIRLPTSGGGLVQYSESEDSKFHFSPTVVIAIIVVIIILEFILHKSL